LLPHSIPGSGIIEDRLVQHFEHEPLGVVFGVVRRKLFFKQEERFEVVVGVGFKILMESILRMQI
jgi:hypothetical protein